MFVVVDDGGLVHSLLVSKDLVNKLLLFRQVFDLQISMLYPKDLCNLRYLG